MQRPFVGQEIEIRDLPRRERFRVYWGCYWRAVLYVAFQTMIMVPVVCVLTFDVGPWKPSPAAGLIGLGITEVISLMLGFVLVASFTKRILNVRFGRLRLTLMAE